MSAVPTTLLQLLSESPGRQRQHAQRPWGQRRPLPSSQLRVFLGYRDTDKVVGIKYEVFYCRRTVSKEAFTSRILYYSSWTVFMLPLKRVSCNGFHQSIFRWQFQCFDLLKLLPLKWSRNDGWMIPDDIKIWWNDLLYSHQTHRSGVYLKSLLCSRNMFSFGLLLFLFLPCLCSGCLSVPELSLIILSASWLRTQQTTLHLVFDIHISLGGAWLSEGVTRGELFFSLQLDLRRGLVKWREVLTLREVNFCTR